MEKYLATNQNVETESQLLNDDIVGFNDILLDVDELKDLSPFNEIRQEERQDPPSFSVKIEGIKEEKESRQSYDPESIQEEESPNKNNRQTKDPSP